MVFWLSDVIMTKELSPEIGKNSRFGTVEIDLSKFIANYRAAGRDSKIVYSHPIQLNRTEWKEWSERSVVFIGGFF